MLDKNNYRVTQWYGKTDYAMLYPELYASFGGIHPGVDLVGNDDLPAMCNGRVVQAGVNGGWGLTVTLYDGRFWHLTAHCSVLYVQVGDYAYLGQKVAKMGNSGTSSGKHLHYSIYDKILWKKIYIDPWPTIESFFNRETNMLIQRLVGFNKANISDLLNGVKAFGYDKEAGIPFVVRDGKRREYSTWNELFGTEFAGWCTTAERESIPKK